MNAVWTVKSVEPLENYKILITFEQNVKKIFDMKPYLNYPMYKPLEDISLFNSVIILSFEINCSSFSIS